MQSVENIPQFETVYVKNEVFTIEEDEIQSIKNDEEAVLDEQQNGGSKLIYYFEPQERINVEDKSKSNNRKFLRR